MKRKPFFFRKDYEMNSAEKVKLIMACTFLPIGVLIFLVTLVTGIIVPVVWIIGGCISLVFIGIGLGFLISFLVKRNKVKEIRENGKKYTGKITGYVEDKSVVVNGRFLMNTKVHYFDEFGVERETIVPTKFNQGNNDFPIGATIDFVEYNNKFSWVEGSVRNEKLEGEDELMDQKPMDPSQIRLAAVSCRSCGASFAATKGYIATCPYCGNRINN